MKFIDEDGDTKRVFSKECFDTWVVTRKEPPKQPEESFRRVLTAHICGVDGRRPFPPKIEANLLQILRKKEVWECFRGTKVSIGIRGFRNFGYHETKGMKLTQAGADDDSSRKRKRRGFDDDITSKLLRTGPLPYFGGAAMNPLQGLLQAQLQLQLQAQQLQQLQQPSLAQYLRSQQEAGLSIGSLPLPQTTHSKHVQPQYVPTLPQYQQPYVMLNGLQTPVNSNALLLGQAGPRQGSI